MITRLPPLAIIIPVSLGVAAPVSLPVSAKGPVALVARGKRKKKRKKKEVFTPEMAASEREQAHRVADPLRDNGELKAAGIAFDGAAAKRGDPVLYLEAGDAYLELAKQDRDPAPAEAAIERGAIALDILYFQLDDASDDDFRVVGGTEVPALITRAEDLQSSAMEVIEEIEAERAAAASAAEEPVDEDKPRDPTRGLTIGGAVMTSIGGVMLGVGVAGLGLGVARQREAEDPTVYGPNYDSVAEQGERANLLAYIGLPVGAVFLGGGIAMLVIASKRKKSGKSPPDESAFRVTPALGPQNAGLSLSGRF